MYLFWFDGEKIIFFVDSHKFFFVYFMFHSSRSGLVIVLRLIRHAGMAMPRLADKAQEDVGKGSLQGRRFLQLCN